MSRKSATTYIVLSSFFLGNVVAQDLSFADETQLQVFRNTDRAPAELFSKAKQKNSLLKLKFTKKNLLLIYITGAARFRP
jgi:hypothetical protein